MDFKSINKWYEITYPNILKNIDIQDGVARIGLYQFEQIKNHSKIEDFYQKLFDNEVSKLKVTDAIGYDRSFPILSLCLSEEEKRKPENVLIYQEMFNSEGVCRKCNLPWSSCKPDHTINLNENLGVFAMCQHCWENSNLEEIKVYYYLIFREHQLKYAETGKIRYNRYSWNHWMKCIEEDYKLNHK